MNAWRGSLQLCLRTHDAGGAGGASAVKALNIRTENLITVYPGSDWFRPLASLTDTLQSLQKLKHRVGLFGGRRTGRLFSSRSKATLGFTPVQVRLHQSHFIQDQKVHQSWRVHCLDENDCYVKHFESVIQWECCLLIFPNFKLFQKTCQF